MNRTLGRFPAMLLTLVAATSLAHDGKVAEEEETRPELYPFSVVDTRGGLSLYEDIYVLPATWSQDYHGDESEIVFQLSAKLRIFRTRLFFGYTQIAFWQVFNADESRPFRETNYNPQLFYRFAPGRPRLDDWVLDLGVDHQSNGQREPGSRSWNRVYATLYHERPRQLVSLRLWYRIEEDDCPLGEDGEELEYCRGDSSYDDNPNLTDYMGYAEAHYRYRWTHPRRPKEIHVMARGNLAAGKGGVGIDYSHAAGSKDLHWFAKVWHGYGESLIDHDRSITRVGVGLMLRRTYAPHSSAADVRSETAVRGSAR